MKKIIVFFKELTILLIFFWAFNLILFKLGVISISLAPAITWSIGGAIAFAILTFTKSRIDK